ncbi:MAG: HAD family phosphatase [Leifsonia flava]
MTTDTPAAVLWDMDGTLVDTEPYWMRAETELIESFGGVWTHEDALGVVGLGLWESARVFQEAGADLDADAIVDYLTNSVQQQLETDGVPWRPGARELLAELRENGVRTALVTMSVKRMADQVAALIGFPAFDVIVTGDSVERPKPFPDAYLAAAEQLGVAASACLAIEDSVPGLASARAAGCSTIGVPHMVPLAASAADVLWPTLEGRTIADLFAVHDRSASDRSAHPGVDRDAASAEGIAR